MRVGHAPVEASAGRFFGLCERRTQHHCVSATDHGLADVAAGAETTVGDDRHVTSCTTEVVFPGRCALEGGGDLGDSHTNNFTGGAGGAGSDSDQQAVDAGFHQLQRHFVSDAVADDNRDFQGIYQFGEDQPSVAIGHVAGGGDGGLDYDHVGPGLDSRGRHAFGVLGGEGDCAGGAGVFDLADALPDEFFADGLGVDFLEEFGDGLLGVRDDLFKD